VLIVADLLPSRLEEIQMRHIEGGCLCGRVRYSADAEPAFVGVCHCKDCQRYSGSAFATVLAIASEALKVTGSLKTFSKSGDSGKLIRRRFCSECGSGILDEAEVLPGVTMINVGTLDDPGWVKPGSEIYCDSAQPWVRLGGEMKRFATTPSQE
jgi:hypothetical protein